MRRSVSWALLCIAAVVPLTVGDQLPFLDWPQHLALASIVRHLHDPAWHFEMYEIDPRPLPYRLFTWLTAILPLPIAVGGRVVLGAALASTPLALGYLLRTMGRDERLAWLAFPLLYGRILFLGFAPFLVGVPLWLLGTALAEQHFSGRPRPWSLAIVGVLTYFAHGWPALALVGSVAVLAVAHRTFRLVPLVPFAALVLYWIAVEATDPTLHQSPDGQPTMGAVFETPSEAVAHAPKFLYEVDNGHADEMAFVVWLVLLLGLVVARRDPIRRAFDARLEILAGAFVVSYFVVPLQQGVAFDLPARNLYLAALLSPVFAGAIPFDGARRWILAPIVALALFVPAFYTRELARFETAARSIRDLAERARDGGSTLGLVYDTGSETPFDNAPYLHAQAWFQVYRGGDASSSFAGFPLVPVRYRAARPAGPDEWDPAALDPAELPQWTRVLVRGQPPFTLDGARVMRSGAFTLIEP